MSDLLSLAERLRAYRPMNEWGDGVHHVICDEAADAIEALLTERDEAAATAWEAAARKAHERLYPKNERADWTDIASHNAYMANEVQLELFEQAAALRAKARLAEGGEP